MKLGVLVTYRYWENEAGLICIKYYSPYIVTPSYGIGSNLMRSNILWIGQT